MSRRLSGSQFRMLILMYLFFALFAAVGGGLFYFLFLKPAFRLISAHSWDERSCVIISSQVETHSDSDSATYSVNIVYTYRVRDREYTSHRYDFMPSGSSSGYEAKAAVVHRYPPGRAAVCYVNPADPTDAVLERKFTSGILLGLLSLPFLIGGLAGIFFFVPQMRESGTL